MTMFAPTIRRIKKVDEITLIDLIALINTISVVSEITNIKNIETIESANIVKETNIANIVENVVNPSFELGDFTHWRQNHVTNLATIETNLSKVHFGAYSAKLLNAIGSGLRYIFPLGLAVERINKLGIHVKSSWASFFNTHDLEIRVTYLDGTTTTVAKTLNDTNWTFEDIQPDLTAGKYVKRFSIVNLETQFLWVDDLELNVKQQELIAVNVIEAMRTRSAYLFHSPATWTDADIEFDGGENGSTTITSSTGQEWSIILHFYKSLGTPDWSKVYFKIAVLDITTKYDVETLKTMLGSQTKTGSFIEFLHIDDTAEDYVIHIRKVERSGNIVFEYGNDNTAGNKIKMRWLGLQQTPAH